MGGHAIAPLALDDNPDLEEIEAQILGLAPMDTLSLEYKIARNALVRAYTDLTLAQNYYEAQVETGNLPIVPKYVNRRVIPALRAGDEALQLLSNIHATIHGGPGIAEFMHGARLVLLRFIRHHSPTTVPEHLARFELNTRHKKRPFTTPSRTKHTSRRQYDRH